MMYSFCIVVLIVKMMVLQGECQQPHLRVRPGGNKGKENEKEKEKEISMEQVLKAQKEWGDAVVAVGQAATRDKIVADAELLADFYGYGECEATLFKPTKANGVDTFRLTRCGALSYFIGPMLQRPCGLASDTGFALQPWSSVRFSNVGCYTGTSSAYCMGTYFFTDAATGDETIADYSFVYERDRNTGDLFITLHHSSFPYVPYMEEAA
jgi:hypothetical protein